MKKLINIILAALAPLLSTGAAAQETARGLSGGGRWSVYVEEGATVAHGLGMKNVDAAPGIGLSFEAGAGAALNVCPWFRVGVNYDFSKYGREQRYSELSPLPSAGADGGEGGNADAAGTYAGLAYARMKASYHAVDMTLEVNLLDLLSHRHGGRFDLYAGAGLGWFFARANTYTVSMGQDRWSDGYKETVDTWLDAANTRRNFDACYVPLRLCAEYGLGRRVTVGLGGDYKWMLWRDNDLSPLGVASVSAVLRINL